MFRDFGEFIRERETTLLEQGRQPEMRQKLSDYRKKIERFQKPYFGRLEEKDEK